MCTPLCRMLMVCSLEVRMQVSCLEGTKEILTGLLKTGSKRGHQKRPPLVMAWDHLRAFFRLLIQSVIYMYSPQSLMFSSVMVIFCSLFFWTQVRRKRVHSTWVPGAPFNWIHLWEGHRSCKAWYLSSGRTVRMNCEACRLLLEYSFGFVSLLKWQRIMKLRNEGIQLKFFLKWKYNCFLCSFKHSGDTSINFLS